MCFRRLAGAQQERQRMIKVLTVFGTRPEAIKLAPVIKHLERNPRFTCVTCVTSQHREMLDQVLEVFAIVPKYDLAVMTPAQSLADVTARVVQKVSEVVAAERPAIVLVQGDTTTTFAAGLAAFYNRVPVGHVEAGLRTSDKYQPFPEEINRRLTTVLADYHYAPTDVARQNLLAEGIDSRRILVTGNTGIDALLMARDLLRQDGQMGDRPAAGVPGGDGQRMILVTAHRRESFGAPFEAICDALRRIVERNPDVTIVYPVHLNPEVRRPVFERLADRPRIHLTEPLAYLPFVAMMDRAYLILTDSGGIQEEAPALGKPVLVMRNTTERPEAVDAGSARLVGTSTETIATAVQHLLDDVETYERMSRARNPFGDGRASERIASHLVEMLGEGECRA
jgi:UDP-N-acetylglucosamine 2-epimerase (non-hydrolysing)